MKKKISAVLARRDMGGQLGCVGGRETLDE